MASHSKLYMVCGLIAATLLLTAGCTTFGPQLGPLAYPIPVSPFFQDQKEDNFWERERYDRVPILPPIIAGAPPRALDEPSDDEIMRALERVHPIEGGFPFLHEVQRNNVRIVKQCMADFIGRPRVIPLIGPAQLHHSRWKCTVFYTNVTRVGWPVPYTTVDEDAREVIYIDHSHFHMAGNVETDVEGCF